MSVKLTPIYSRSVLLGQRVFFHTVHMLTEIIGVVAQTESENKKRASAIQLTYYVICIFQVKDGFLTFLEIKLLIYKLLKFQMLNNRDILNFFP